MGEGGRSSRLLADNSPTARPPKSIDEQRLTGTRYGARSGWSVPRRHCSDPRRAPSSGPFRGHDGVTAGVEQNGTQTERGVYQEQRGGCTTPPVVFALSLLVSFVLARRSRTAPAVRDKTGATPPFVPLERHGEGWVSATVSGTVSDPFPRRWGRSRPYVSLREGSPAAPAGRTTTPGAHGRSTARHAAGGRLES